MNKWIIILNNRKWLLKYNEMKWKKYNNNE